MVFVEAPCGVGFSYSDNEDDYYNNDRQTAIDNYSMIQAFFERFPQYRTNDLYLASESYGGHYMPTLAKEIVDQNTADVHPHLNLKGFAVGNPYTNFYSGIPASVVTYWGHQLISKPVWDELKGYCEGLSQLNNLYCGSMYATAFMEIGDLNHYALDYPVCLWDAQLNTFPIAKHGRAQRHWFMNHILDSIIAARAEEEDKDSDCMSSEGSKSVELIRQALKLGPVDCYEPCEQEYTTEYLAQLAVKEALHVNTDVVWVECSYTLR